MPLPSPSFDNNIVSWTSRYDMQGTYAGTVELTNEASQYNFNTLVYTPYELSMTITSVLGNVDDPDNCFSGTIRVLSGLVTDVEIGDGLSEKNASFSIKSYFFRLGKKAINTESFTNVTAKVAMNQIFQNYLGVPGAPDAPDDPDALWDFSYVAENRIFGPIAGNNVLDEMKRLAQAGQSTLCVTERGILKALPWKDHTSDVDLIIPDEAIKSARLARSDDVGPTRIVVRGGFFSRYQLGYTPYHSTPSTDDSPCARGQVPVTWCLWVGVPITQYDQVLPLNQRADAPINGRFIIRGIGDSSSIQPGETGVRPADPGVTPNNGIGQVVVGITGAGPSNFLGAGPHTYEIDARGLQRASPEWDNPNAKFGALNDLAAHLSRGGMTHALSYLDAGPSHRGGPASGGGVRNSGGNLNADRHSDEAEGIQFELAVDDPGLQAKFGVITEQIENPYVKDKTLLFRIAVRRFQEFRMERISWELELAPLTCLHLNDKVTFHTPETEDGGFREITGVVSQMSYTYNADNSSLTQKIVVQSMEDIGGTEYLGTDLTSDASFSSVDENDWWSASIPANSAVSGGNGGIRIDAAVSEDPMVTLTEHNFQTDSTYNLLIRVMRPSGTSPILLSILDGLGNTLQAPVSVAEGTTAHTFTTQDSSTVFFHLQVSAGAATTWVLSRFDISQTVIA